MARAKSVVLTKEEKKDLIAGAKAAIKEAKQCLKNIDASIKAAEKAHALSLKQAAKDRTVSAKALQQAENTLAGLMAA